MTANQFRKIALGFEGATEGSHMKHPDFRANGKIFATIHEGDTQGMVSLTPEQQDRFLREHPSVFSPAAGSWGRQGATIVQFDAADPEVVGEAMTLAWQNISRQMSRDSATRRTKTRRIGRTRR
jgi:hypothetical protein